VGNADEVERLGIESWQWRWFAMATLDLVTDAGASQPCLNVGMGATHHHRSSWCRLPGVSAG